MISREDAMTLPTRRIIYVGCGLAGKVTSLLSALHRAGQEGIDPVASEWPLRRGLQRFILTRKTTPFLELSVRVSDKRATMIDYDPVDARDEQLREELDQIATADGLVVVINSHSDLKEANVEAFKRLLRDIRSRNVDAVDKPMVFQANKRDLPDVVSMEWVRENFHANRCAYVESIARNGSGTFEALKEVLRLTGGLNSGGPYERA